MDVQLPDGTTVKGVPDGTSKADLFAKLKANGHPVDDSWLGSTPAAPAPKQSMPAFVGGNLSKGVADVAGLPVDLANSAIEGTKGVANLFGAHLKADSTPIGGSEWIKQKLAKIGAIGPSAEPRTSGQKIAAAALEAGPSAVLPGGDMKAIPRVVSAATAGAGGEIGRQIGGAPGQIAGSMLGGAAGGMAGMERGIPKPPTEAVRASADSGIPLTIGQETGNKVLTASENKLRELFTSTGVAHADELKQVAAGADRVTDLADQLSKQGTADPEAIGNRLRNAYTDTVKKIDGARDAQAKTDYGNVRALAGDKPVIGYKNTMKTLDEIIAQNENVPAADAKKVTAQARDIKRALTDTTPPSAILGPSGKPLVGAATGAATHTIQDAMKTRSAWGKAAQRSGNIFSDIDPNANQILAKRLFGAINKDFEDASTAQTPIGQALKTANTNYKKASDSITFVQKSALGKLLGEDVTDAAFSGQTASTKAPEMIAKRYLSMQPSEAKSVTAILQSHAPDVLNEAKSFVLRNGLQAAKNDAPGAMPISFAKFRTEIDRVQPKLEEMGFSKKEIADIKDVTDTMARAGDRTGKNPSGTAASSQAGAIAGGFFIHPLVSIGLAGLPYVLSKALLTSKGRDLIRAAMDTAKTLPQQARQKAAIGALRGLLPQTHQAPPPAPPQQPQGQLAPPPAGP
jgi:hypothetical protein